MAFMSKTDYYNLTGDALVCITSGDGRSASLAQAKGANGEIVASQVYGETESPSCEYRLRAPLVTQKTEESDTRIKLGKVVTLEDKKYVLGNFSISTAAGSAATVSASGEQVADDAEQGLTFALPPFSLPVSQHAQILFQAFSVDGSGCHLLSANYTGSVSITKATKDGVCLSHDVSEGKIEAAVTVTQTGTEKPILTPGTGWSVTSPLACSNPDSDYPTWSGTLTCFLPKE